MTPTLPDASFDVPIRERPIEGYHEAHWVFGYDPAVRFGYYLYLLADKTSPVRRNETVMLFLPDGTIRTATGAGDGTFPPTVAGRDLAFGCVIPFQRWTVRFSGGAGPKGEHAALDLVLEAAAPPWNTEGPQGEAPPAFRHHQLNRVTGTATIDGRAMRIGGMAMRSRSFRRRDAITRGHVIATALFPSGKCFGLFCYLDAEGQRTAGHGYVGSAAGLKLCEVLALPSFNDEKAEIRLRDENGREDRIRGEIATMAYRTLDRDGRHRPGIYRDEQAALISASAFCAYRWQGETGYGPLDRSEPVSRPC